MNERNCERCGKGFLASNTQVAKGYGRFCSISCCNLAHSRKGEPVTAEYLRETLDYDPETGHLTWRSDRKFAKAGDIAGGIKTRSHRLSYVVIYLNGKNHYAHRLAFLWMTGEWPNEVDHLDGDGTNNAWSNLSNGTHSDNMRNTILNKRKRAG